MKKILAISEPLLRSYPYHAHLSSVVGVRSECYVPWVYNYFVQLYTAKDFEYEKRVDYTTPYIYDFMPGILTNRVSREVALEAWDGILGFIRSNINHGYYVYGLFDVSQIAAYNIIAFFLHDPMLYGYDDEKEEIYFVDNYNYGKYSHGIASYKEIVKATEEFSRQENLATIDWMRGFLCIKYDDKVEPFVFNKSIYVGLLWDYLNEQDSRYRWMQPWEIRREDENIRWGIGVYSVMQEYLIYMKKDKCGEALDKRCFFVEMEQKQLLEKTITYLLGKDWKTLYPVEWHLLEKDIKMTTIMLNLCLKYNLTLDVKLIDSLRSYLTDLEANDRLLFPSLINLVSNYAPEKIYVSVSGDKFD